MNKLNLWKINEICSKHCIGLEQMGAILPKIYNLLTDDNQEDIFELIGELADKTGCSIKYIIEHVELKYK